MKCIIVEDEPKAANLLSQYIKQINDLELLEVFHDAIEALNYTSQTEVDLIFADIEMPNLNGMDFTAMVRPKILIIFTTAYSSFAVESYERNTVDYLLKPFSFKRFYEAIEKARNLFQLQKDPDSHAREGKGEEFMFIKSGKQLLKLELAKVLYLEGYKEYIKIHTEETDVLYYNRMKQASEVFPAYFIRVHNSFIVNIKRIDRIEDNCIIIKKATIPISNTYRDHFYQALKSWTL